MAANTNVATDLKDRPRARAPGDVPKERVLVITRLFDAPRALVFKMWTAPEHMVRWWGCGQTQKVDVTEHDLRPGGRWRVVMRQVDGGDHVLRGIFREIETPERLVFTWSWEDADGNIGHQTVVTVTFAERGPKTEMTLHHAVFETTEMRDLHGDGWTASLDRLAEYLKMTPA